MTKRQKSTDSVKKAESLSEKMAKIHKNLGESVDIANDVYHLGENLESNATEVSSKISESNRTSYIPESASAVLDLETMIDDFKFIRNTLKENADNGGRVLNAITLKLLEEGSEKKANLIMSFAELNKAIADNIKLYISSYKDLSNVIKNIQQVQEREQERKMKDGGDSAKESDSNVLSHSDIISSLDEDD